MLHVKNVSVVTHWLVSVLIQYTLCVDGLGLLYPAYTHTHITQRCRAILTCQTPVQPSVRRHKIIIKRDKCWNKIYYTTWIKLSFISVNRCVCVQAHTHTHTEDLQPRWAAQHSAGVSDALWAWSGEGGPHLRAPPIREKAGFSWSQMVADI